VTTGTDAITVNPAAASVFTLSDVASMNTYTYASYTLSVADVYGNVNIAGVSTIDLASTSTSANKKFFVGSFDTPGNTFAAAVSGAYAYVADGGAGLQIINISNAAAPIPISTFDTTGSAREIVVSGAYAYVADFGSGLQIINISNLSVPTRTGTFYTPDYTERVVVSGNYAYLANWDVGGLQIINISNSAVPTLIGTFNTPGNSYSVTISGTYAYMADAGAGLQIINITNAAVPTRTGAFDTPGSALGVVVSGTYAYMADGGAGLQIINITNAAVPTRTGIFDTPGVAYDVVVSGTYAFVADEGSGLQIINISNAAVPTLIGTFDTTGWAYGVVVSGAYAYVADLCSGLQIINISDLVHPTLILPISSAVTQMTILDGYSDAGFLYYDDTAGTYTISASKSAFTTGTDSIIVNDGAAASLSLNDLISMTAGTGVPYTLSVKDASGNPTAIGVSNIDLASSSSGGNKKFAVSSFKTFLTTLLCRVTTRTWPMNQQACTSLIFQISLFRPRRAFLTQVTGLLAWPSPAPTRMWRIMAPACIS
jgi:hypothetical protein